MSAFLVSKAHIDALVRAALTARHPLHWYDGDLDALAEDYAGERYWLVIQDHARHAEHATADTVGRMLWLENLASIRYRYPDTVSGERPGPRDLTDERIAAYTYPRQTPSREPAALLKALACYEYQSCEHPGWKTSEAWYFCEALRRALIGALPGYDEASWEIT